jgi:hypothetical protein
LKFSSLSTAWISLFLYYNMKWLKYPHPLSWRLRPENHYENVWLTTWNIYSQKSRGKMHLGGLSPHMYLCLVN